MGRRIVVDLTAALAAALMLTSCAAPESAPPTGIDHLEIPTPSAHPSDFVKDLDAPYFPRVSTPVEFAATPTQTGRLTINFGTPELIAGVWATPYQIGIRGAYGHVSARAVWFVASDQEGNVWLMGETFSGAYGDRSWRAGQSGAEAGLVVAATPRRGDGYFRERVPGGPADVVRTERVSAMDPSLTQECGDCVELTITSADTTSVIWLKRDVGLVKLIDPLGNVWLPHNT